MVKPDIFADFGDDSDTEPLNGILIVVEFDSAVFETDTCLGVAYVEFTAECKIVFVLETLEAIVDELFASAVDLSVEYDALGAENEIFVDTDVILISLEPEVVMG